MTSSLSWTRVPGTMKRPRKVPLWPSGLYGNSLDFSAPVPVQTGTLLCGMQLKVSFTAEESAGAERLERSGSQLSQNCFLNGSKKQTACQS